MNYVYGIYGKNHFYCSIQHKEFSLHTVNSAFVKYHKFYFGNTLHGLLCFDIQV
jgi:hypothetical protein